MPIQESLNGHVTFHFPFQSISSEKEADATEYTDRLFQRDPEKYNRLCEKHFGDTGQGRAWRSRSPENIESFLEDFLGKEIELVNMERQVHQARGFELYRIDYATVQ